MKTELNYRNFLISELETRKRRNPSYSLRAFARDLEVPASRLSEVINGKVGLSEERAVKIAERLGFSASDRELFVNLVLSEHSRSAVIKKLSQQRVQQRNEFLTHIDEDTFKLISDWHYAAIMEILISSKMPHDANTFAKRLGISPDLVASSLERLERLNLIEKKDDRWVCMHGSQTTAADIPSEAVRSFHKQVINKAMDSIEKQPVENRDISSLMVSINKNQIPLVKQRLESFRRSLMIELETASDRESVYCLALQFFEITEA